MLLDQVTSLIVRFGNYLVDLIVPLSIGGFSKFLVNFSLDFSVNCSVYFSVAFWVRVSINWLSVVFALSVELDRVDLAISFCENLLLGRRHHHHIDCRLAFWLGSSVTWI